MKKLITFILALMMLFALISCGGDNGQDSGDGGNVEDENNGGGTNSTVYIYSKDYLPTIITADNSIPSELTAKLYDALKTALGTAPYTSNDTTESEQHEIVIGESSRAITAKAHYYLKRLNHPEEGEVRWLIYSDGSSLAIVYGEDTDYIGLYAAINELVTKYVEIDDKLICPKGVLASGFITVDDYFNEIESDFLTEKWQALADALDESYRDELVEAMKNLYKLYSDDLISWFANLYDPAVGGYYYSNSGRDNHGFLPDIESTAQALGFITKSGMAEEYGGKYSDVIPEWMQKQIVYFFKSLQDENGYFYHPQWTRELTDSKLSRKSRDLGNAVSVLRAFGSNPTYSTPNGDKGDGITADQYIGVSGALTPSFKSSSATLASSIALAAAVPSHLVDKDTFLAYLATLDITNNSYSVGNTLTAQKSAIIQRDKELKAAGADYSLMDMLINWLNEHQIAETGLWHHTVNYYAINGLMKISGVYGGAGILMPNAAVAVKAAVAAITSDEECGAVVDIYNTWYATERVLRHMREYGNDDDKKEAESVLDDLRKNAPLALKSTAEKIAKFKKEDGSFSYTPKASSANSQGCPVAVRDTNEGDVNATVICSSDILYYIYSALDLYDVFVPIYTKSDMRRYLNMLEELDPVIKDEEDPMDEPIDFEAQADGDLPSDVRYSNRSTELGGHIMVKSGYGTNKSKVLAISSKDGKSDSVTVDCRNYSNMSCYVFEADFAVGSASSSYYAQITMGNCYMFTLRKSGDKVSIVEASSGTNKLSQNLVFDVSPDLGEWFNIKVEYFALANGEARIKFYYNGKLIAVTDNYYCNDGSKLAEGAKPNAPKEYKEVLIWMMKTGDAEIYIDNIASYKTNDVYTPVTGADSPAINVDKTGN